MLILIQFAMVIDYNFRFDNCMKYIKNALKMIQACILCDIHSVSQEDILSVYRGDLDELET